MRRFFFLPFAAPIITRFRAFYIVGVRVIRLRHHEQSATVYRGHYSFKIDMPSAPGKKWADFRTGDLATTIIGPKATVLKGGPKPLPTRRSSDNCLVFDDYPTFRPNKTPFEVLEAGSFGGGYFRPIYSDVVKSKLKDQHKEFSFLDSLPKEKLTQSDYDASVNKYKVKCGGSLQMWQSKGWISPIDPYGWFQWYVSKTPLYGLIYFK